MSPSLTSSEPAVKLPVPLIPAPSTSGTTQTSREVLATTAFHCLLWLVIANAIGILIAAMLVLPGINNLLGEWTYGRWMPVHMNLQLYGWCSLPLVMFLFHVYGADRKPMADWARPVLWTWSTALAAGSVSWLSGHSSGKLFLDWTGYPRVLFPVAMLALWLLLTASYCVSRPRYRTYKIIGLALLLVVPFLIYIASNPALYPPVNPDTGGPTGASQLESSLVIIAVLLLLPFGLTERQPQRRWPLPTAWIIFAAETVLCLGLGRADVSHHRPIQWISLGSLLVWIPLTPAYFREFKWHRNTRLWRIAFLCWWSVLIPTGWALFLPGVLDHFKFTDGLVGHSLLAMAGFVSSLLIFVMVQLMGDDGWIFNGTWSFYTWQASALAYVLIMFYAGWREGSDPAFSIVPGLLRNGIYTVRLLLGVLLFAASLDWFVDALTLHKELRQHKAVTV